MSGLNNLEMENDKYHLKAVSQDHPGNNYPFSSAGCKEQRAANFGQFQDLAIADPTLAVNCQQITRLFIEKFAEIYAMHIIFASDLLENWLMFNFKSIVKFIGKATITFTLSPFLEFYES